MSRVLYRPRSPGVLLLCLDALSPAADSDGPALPLDPPWRANAARLVAHARAQGWSVAHVVSRRRRPGQAPWRPFPGLAPLPSEAVYHREGASAFSSPELCEAVRRGGGDEVVLCGVSAGGSGLSTALDAHRVGAALTLAEDAASLPASEKAGVEGVLRLQRLGQLPALVRLAPTEVLLRPWRRLRLLEGGRRS